MADIIFTNHEDRVTIEITGEASENLKEIAKIFNAWDEGDNTPSDIVDRFMCDTDGWYTLSKKQSNDRICEIDLPGMICATYQDAPDIGDLEDAFHRAGFTTNA